MKLRILLLFFLPVLAFGGIFDLPQYDPAGDKFKKQVDNLTSIASKGVHKDVLRGEARRCFISLLVLIDDIISLNGDPFEIAIELDESLLERFTKRANKSGDDNSE